jgi:hypothetical protein
MTHTRTPHIDAVYALTTLLAQTIAASRAEPPAPRPQIHETPRVADTLQA